MLSYLQQLLAELYRSRNDSLNLVLWRDSDPDHPSSYRFTPIVLLLFWLLTILGGSFLLGIVLYVTPIGERVFNREDEALRAEVVTLGQRILSIQDSLDNRDAQLDNIKQILYDGQDTLFNVNRPIAVPDTAPVVDRPTAVYQRTGGLSQAAIRFPIRFPIRGMLTQRFRPEAGHFGVDLSATTGDPFYVVADGAVISAEWTLMYGFVIKVQHAEGYLSIYKHTDRPLRNEGELVRQGDLLGFISNTGILSSGPHLHIELWKDGVPLDPEFYFTKR
jgi:hypothetical protein